MCHYFLLLPLTVLAFLPMEHRVKGWCRVMINLIVQVLDNSQKATYASKTSIITQYPFKVKSRIQSVSGKIKVTLTDTLWECCGKILQTININYKQAHVLSLFTMLLLFCGMIWSYVSHELYF